MYLRGNMLSRLALSVILVVATAVLARAGATTPTLIVQSADTGSAISGAQRLVTFRVAYDYGNAIQADYDIELIVFQGSAFARYPISGAARIGTSGVLADGLSVADLAAVDAASAPAPAGVRIATIEPARVTVTLPVTFSSEGQATAVLVATVDEGVILSNPLGFDVP
jgi:hypothetical protein